MHFLGSILPLPFNALVGQAEIQAFLHHSGQAVLTVGAPGVNSLSITMAMGSVHEPPLATLFE